MKKGTWLISIVGFGLLALLTMLCITIPLIWQDIKNLSRPYELPTEKIRHVFLSIADQELPKKTDNLRAIFQRGPDPSMFLRFDTDSDGIEHIKRSFAGPGTRSKYIDEDTLTFMRKADLSLFVSAPRMQDDLGVSLFDQKSIKPGLEINFAAGSGSGLHMYYQIFIEDQQSTVYIFVALI